MEWVDLSDDELLARLVNRGTPPGVAAMMVRQRDHPTTATEIDRRLAR